MTSRRRQLGLHRNHCEKEAKNKGNERDEHKHKNINKSSMSYSTTRNTKWDYDAVQRVRREGADPCIVLYISFSLDGFYIEAHRRLASYRLKAFHVFEPRRTRQKKKTQRKTKTIHSSHEHVRRVSNGSVKFPKGKQQL